MTDFGERKDSPERALMREVQDLLTTCFLQKRQWERAEDESDEITPLERLEAQLLAEALEDRLLMILCRLNDSEESKHAHKNWSFRQAIKAVGGKRKAELEVKRKAFCALMNLSGLEEERNTRTAHHAKTIKLLKRASKQRRPRVWEPRADHGKVGEAIALAIELADDIIGERHDVLISVNEPSINLRDAFTGGAT